VCPNNPNLKLVDYAIFGPIKLERRPPVDQLKPTNDRDIRRANEAPWQGWSALPLRLIDHSISDSRNVVCSRGSESRFAIVLSSLVEGNRVKTCYQVIIDQQLTFDAQARASRLLESMLLSPPSHPTDQTVH